MKNYLFNSGFVTASLFAALLLVSCAKKDELSLAKPVIIEVKLITSSSATVYCNITSLGNGTISESGICYSVTVNPDVTKFKVLNTQGNGKFTSVMKNLLPNTQYYARAYAINQMGTAYSDEFPVMTGFVKAWVPDALFRAALKAQFPSGFDTSDSLNVSGINIRGFNGAIDVSNKLIGSLVGIEYFPALTSLTCSSNLLTSMDLSKNTALISVSCSSNLLTSVDVSKSVALTQLDCDGNKLTTLDLSKNTALSTLFCANNLLTSLDIRSQISFDGVLAILKDYSLLVPWNSGNTGLATLKVNAAVQQNGEIVNVKTSIPGCVISTYTNGTLVCPNYNPITNTCP